MANRCAGLDPTWAHLPTPAPTHGAYAAASHYYSCPAAAFENEALTSALRASMAPAHGAAADADAKASSFTSPATPSSSTSSASELLSSGHDALAPATSRPAAGRPPARALAGPRGDRVTKRKPRPSRRAQTTYITADPANFRRMVQEITGLPVSGPSSFRAASEAATTAAAAAAPSWTPATAPVLPTLDTSAFLLDRPTPAPEDNSSSGGSASAAADAAAGAAPAGDDDSSLLLELDAMICFPTLESWAGMI